MRPNLPCRQAAKRREAEFLSRSSPASAARLGGSTREARLSLAEGTMTNSTPRNRCAGTLRVTLIVCIISACGDPVADLPDAGNDRPPRPPPAPPMLQPVPSRARYPFTRLALRGTSVNASRVIIEGAGNPLSVPVQQVEFGFCSTLDLPRSPAEYILTLKSLDPRGEPSAPVEFKVYRDNTAPFVSDLVDCMGRPITQ